ncbi:MAG: precorrin-6y C5,15-methyltransferase (decarboxylating) subunit CbiE [Acidaminococcaceae bacterium]|nr:precorrin-6y C5,15-methyltransferase (decarboxylating) subunit CbiE [Acidaminococcaceae bacterium]
MLKVNVIGIGPGNPDLLTGAARQAIAESTVLAGDRRMVGQFGEGKKVYPTIKLAELAEIAANADAEKDVLGILVSGDVGFFSLAKTIAGKLPRCEVKRYCGISSLVYFASRLQMSWDDAKIISMHGRQQNLVSAVLQYKKVFSLTGGENSPQVLCRQLCRQGLEDVLVHVGSDLSYPEEKIVTGTASEIAQGEFPSLSVMMILNENAGNPLRQCVHGLDDSLFLRGKAPMTKQEIRAVSISKLQPRPDDIIYDIGAGTGSCSVELALQAPQGKLYAFEMKEEALELLRLNRERFHCDNMEIVPGEASEEMEKTPVPDCVFIGGSSGNMAKMLDSLYARNPACRIVINVIALETLCAVVEYYKEKTDYVLDVVNIASAYNKKLGRYNLMMAQNPIYIITAVKKIG